MRFFLSLCDSVATLPAASRPGERGTFAGAAYYPCEDQTGQRIRDGLGSACSWREEYPMGSTADKIKGTANEAIGKAKQGIGEATGSERLQGEGLVQEGKGHAQ